MLHDRIIRTFQLLATRKALPIAPAGPLFSQYQVGEPDPKFGNKLLEEVRGRQWRAAAANPIARAAHSLEGRRQYGGLSCAD